MRWHLEAANNTASQILGTAFGFSELFQRNIPKNPKNNVTFSYLTARLSSFPRLVALQVHITLAFPTSFSCARVQTVPRGGHLWIRCILASTAPHPTPEFWRLFTECSTPSGPSFFTQRHPGPRARAQHIQTCFVVCWCCQSLQRSGSSDIKRVCWSGESL